MNHCSLPLVIRYFAWLGMIFVFSGCTGSLVLETHPSAMLVRTTDGRELGKTPLELAFSEMGKEVSGGHQIALLGEGYRTVHLWVPNVSGKIKMKFNAAPFYFREHGSTASLEIDVRQADINRLIESLIQLQLQLLSGEDFDQKALERLVEANPTLGSVHYLDAIASIRSQKLDEAKRKIVEAIRFAPEEIDFQILDNEIKNNSRKSQ